MKWEAIFCTFNSLNITIYNIQLHPAISPSKEIKNVLYIGVFMFLYSKFVQGVNGIDDSQRHHTKTIIQIYTLR